MQMNAKQLFFRRAANKSNRILNLYYVGQDTNPGAGVVFSIISGQVVADRIKDELS